MPSLPFILAVAAMLASLPLLLAPPFWPLPALLALANLAALLLFGLDKALAIAGRRRIPEWWLHALTLCAGAAGACLGRALFRHKTRKPAFSLSAALGIALLLALAAWRHAPLIPPG